MLVQLDLRGRLTMKLVQNKLKRCSSTFNKQHLNPADSINFLLHKKKVSDDIRNAGTVCEQKGERQENAIFDNVIELQKFQGRRSLSDITAGEVVDKKFCLKSRSPSLPRLSSFLQPDFTTKGIGRQTQEYTGIRPRLNQACLKIDYLVAYSVASNQLLSISIKPIGFSSRVESKLTGNSYMLRQKFHLITL